MSESKFYAHAVELECFQMPEFAKDINKMNDEQKADAMDDFLNAKMFYSDIKTETKSQNHFSRVSVKFIAVCDYTVQELVNEIFPDKDMKGNLYSITVITMENCPDSDGKYLPQARLFNADGKEVGEKILKNYVPNEKDASILIEMVKAAVLKETEADFEYQFPESQKEYERQVYEAAKETMDGVEASCRNQWGMKQKPAEKQESSKNETEEQEQKEQPRNTEPQEERTTDSQKSQKR